MYSVGTNTPAADIYCAIPIIKGFYLVFGSRREQAVFVKV